MWDGAQVRGDVGDFDAVFGHGHLERVVISHISPTGLSIHYKFKSFSF